MRKLIYGALAMATALTITAGVNTQSAAAAKTTTPTPTVTNNSAGGELSAEVDLVNQSMVVTGKTQISVAFPTVKVKDGKATVTVKNWDVYEGTEATVDLSKLNPSKGGYVAIKDESGAKQLLIFTAETRKFNAVYTPALSDDAKPSIEVQNAKAALAAGDDTVFQYRTTYSGWTKLNSDTDLSSYVQEGAQLIIRSAAVEAKDEETVDYTVPSDYTAVVEGTLPSKEFKVKIAAKANGPKVTADYKNNRYKLTKGTQYRTEYSGDWTAAPADLIVKLSDLSDKVVLQSRTPADSTKKKAASKITSVNVVQPAAAPTLIDLDEDSYGSILEQIQVEATGKDTEILDVAGQSVTVKLDAKKGTIITNKTGTSIDVVATTGTTDKVTTIKDTKSATIKYAAGTSLAIRYSAVTKDVVDKTTKEVTTPATWASESAELGEMVKAYEAPAASPAASEEP